MCLQLEKEKIDQEEHIRILMKFPNLIPKLDVIAEEQLGTLDKKLGDLIKANALKISLLEEKSNEYRKTRMDIGKKMATKVMNVPLTGPIELTSKDPIYEYNRTVQQQDNGKTWEQVFGNPEEPRENKPHNENDHVTVEKPRYKHQTLSKRAW
jgi:hypothetical protein